MTRPLAGIVLLLVLLLSAPLQAQTARTGGQGEDAAPERRAPVFLEPGHWAFDVLRRLGALGVAPPASDPMAAPVTLQHARRVLQHAAAHPGAAVDIAAMEGWLALLAQEGGAPDAALVVRVHAGWMSVGGEALGGDGYFAEEDWEGARPLADRAGVAAGLAAHGHVTPWLAWSLQASRVAHGWALPSGSVTAAVGPFDAWAGRRRLHYGAGRGGGTVLGSGMNAAPELTLRSLYSLDGLGLHTREPFLFPSFLGFLGPSRVEIAGGRLPRNGNVELPFVLFGRLTTSPFSPRLVVGVNRGAIFGGRGNPVTAGRLAGLLIGLHGGEGGEFENQVLSGVARYRPPLWSLPLELYLEWGMDDTAGAISDMPAIVAGVDLGAVPGLPAASLGVEATRFPVSCCGNPIWYRSVFFRGSWADEGRLFAHPLGGHGRELLGHARLDLPQHGLLIRAGAFLRSRGSENLFVPGQGGRSRGGSISLDYRMGGTGLRLDAGLEDGVAWRSHRAAVHLSHSFTGLRP